MVYIRIYEVQNKEEEHEEEIERGRRRKDTRREGGRRREKKEERDGGRKRKLGMKSQEEEEKVYDDEDKGEIFQSQEKKRIERKNWKIKGKENMRGRLRQILGLKGETRKKKNERMKEGKRRSRKENLGRSWWEWGKSMLKQDKEEQEKKENRGKGKR